MNNDSREIKKVIANAGINVHNGLIHVGNALLLIALTIAFHACYTG